MFDNIQIPESKILGVMFLGIILYLGSAYLNLLKINSAYIGVGIGLILIISAFIVQILSWAGVIKLKGKTTTKEK